jgi:minor histocompatibility antigen H13
VGAPRHARLEDKRVDVRYLVGARRQSFNTAPIIGSNMIIRRQIQSTLLGSFLLTGYAFHTPSRSVAYLASARTLFPGSKQTSISDDVEANDGAVQESPNAFVSFMNSLVPQSNNDAASTKTQPPLETEEEKLKRLKVERLAEIEAGEVRRQQRVSEDKLGYLFLFLLQFLPLLGSNRVISIIYFFGLAVTTVYLGGRQEVIDVPQKISRKSAIYAPLFASVSIGVLYFLLKIGIDPTSLYAIGVTLFGVLAVSDIFVPILRNIFPEYDFANAEVEVPEGVANVLDLDKPSLPVDGLVTLGIGVLCTLVYWTPIALEQKFLVSNFIAWSLGMVSLGAISLGSYQTGALFLAGLFCYDAFWVFGTDVMMTVATKVEAPVKFLFTAPPSDVPRSYPFSVLGLGDVVIPGLFVRLMTKIDEILQPKNLSYFNVATAAYAGGLALCFGANEIYHNGQPALFYLDPALVGGTLACAAVNNQLTDVWEFKEEEDNEEVKS